ncbi:MAG: tyrosine-protein phosphatase [Blastocatellia bacterium]|jgi:atypical dual specificity phosphatase|nr:tyrosine-protein phosphatase [Blastocatellia bacterium]
MCTEFHWVIDGLLAGSAKPGLLNTLEEDVNFLKAMGIELVVTLTELPFTPSLSSFGFRQIHFPIQDMSFPTPKAGQQICEEIVKAVEERSPTLLHCKAGLGRTGMMLACCLVSMGKDPEQALIEVRKRNRAYVQTQGQANFIKHYAQYINSLKVNVQV